MTAIYQDGIISGSMPVRIERESLLDPLVKHVQEACKRNEFSSDIAGLTGRISSLSEEELIVFLQELCTHLSLDDHPEKVLHALSESLSREKIEGILKRKYNSFEDALSDAKERLERCKEFLSKTGPTDSPSFSARARHLFECLVSALEAFLHAFGVADFFKPSQNSMDAQMKSGQIQSIIYFASFLTTTLMSFSFGPAVGLIVTSILALIAALSLVYPYISPMPSYLPEAENFSHMVRMKELPEVYGRKKILDNIANALIESRQVKKHPLLIGESGVGKTKTIEAFVHAIERGDYPELAGKQVFYFSTGKLVNATAMFSSSNNILNRISDAMGRHRENIILVFDEIHEAARAKGESATLSEELKVMLDPGPGRFPFFIGMTTKKEYEEHIKGAFLRRFEEIRVENMGKEEIIKVLSSYLYQSLPSILIEEGAIEYLIEQCETNFPDKAEPV